VDRSDSAPLDLFFQSSLNRSAPRKFSVSERILLINFLRYRVGGCFLSKFSEKYLKCHFRFTAQKKIGRILNPEQKSRFIFVSSYDFFEFLRFYRIERLTRWFLASSFATSRISVLVARLSSRSPPLKYSCTIAKFKSAPLPGKIVRAKPQRNYLCCTFCIFERQYQCHHHFGTR